MKTRWFLLILSAVLTTGCVTLIKKTPQGVQKPVISATKIFEGNVYIETTLPDRPSWENAGWSFDKNQVNNDWILENPSFAPRCMLYPLEHSNNRFIGYCKGNVIIPIQAAKTMLVVENGAKKHFSHTN